VMVNERVGHCVGDGGVTRTTLPFEPPRRRWRLTRRRASAARC